MFINYAHRGASAYAPENTMSSFNKGIELGATGIELDLQKTKDGKIVIFHDDTLERHSNASGKVSNYTYEELLQFDFGSWFDEKYKGEKIVLFENFAKEYLQKELTFAIELKHENIERETIDIINKYATHDNIYVSSFTYDYLANMRKIDKNIKLSWLIQKIDKENIQKLLKIQGTQICPKAQNTIKEDVKLAKDNGLEVRLWGIFDEEIMSEAYKLDTEGMTVNFPDKLKELIDKNRIKK